MMKAYDKMAPMTYVPGGIETSRIGVLYVSADLLPRIEAATAESAGSLSKTHLPLGCSFNDQRMKGTAQEKSTEPARRGAVAVMSKGGGRRWRPSPQVFLLPPTPKRVLTRREVGRGAGRRREMGRGAGMRREVGRGTGRRREVGSEEVGSEGGGEEGGRR